VAFSIETYLRAHGPARASTIAAELQAQGLSAQAARQRVSRTHSPVRRFPIPLLPKREGFLYLESQRNTEQFWDNFMRDLRAAGSVYAAGVDGVVARGGHITAAAFDVVSGAPSRPQKGQVAADLALRRLISAGLIKTYDDADMGPMIMVAADLGRVGSAGHRARQLGESILLDGLREWARKLGLASYNSIAIRGEPELQPIGAFSFDLGGPSYLLPLQGGAGKPGFLAADVFADGTLDAEHIQFFVRKARMLKASLPGVGVMSMLLAERFTGAALTAGHKAGIIPATPRDLFGQRVGQAMHTLLDTLRNAGAYAASSPDRLVYLLDNLVDIEGRAGNLRGVLFELMAGYLARRDAVSIDLGVTAVDPQSGKRADIDVQKVAAQASSVTAIECKGKTPGGVVTLEEVETWLRKLPIIKSHYRAQSNFRESELICELWTSGVFAPDALERLEAEKAQRTRMKIYWKDGAAILALAVAGKEKAMSDALYQHFLKHPLAEVVVSIGGEPVAGALDGYHPGMLPYLGYAHINTPPDTPSGEPKVPNPTPGPSWLGRLTGTAVARLSEN
jgi:hypothetical protein